ncbi:site-specific DNA-methyltransferase [Elizabethkingia anophelis]|nr:site-specific DNA-methyltransferase [Elizabethkingia anophelis]
MQITDKITITNEDNMDLMARYPDGYFDLAIVDLEYCIGASKPTDKSGFVKQKNGDKKFVKQPNYIHKDWDLKLSSPVYFNELFRVSKKQIIKGGNYYGLTGGYLVWNKINGDSDQFGCELFWLSFTKRTDIFHYMWAGMMQGVYCGTNIKEALIQQGNKSLNEKRIHPTQTPVPVYKYILSKYAQPGYKILSTHLGSGSDAIAFYDMVNFWKLTDNNSILNSEFVGCELEKSYYDDSINRIKHHIAFNQSLFQPEELTQTLF